MENVPNRYEVWIFYDPICNRADWFLEYNVNSIQKVVDALKDTMMYFHDDLKTLDKYVDIKAFRNKREIKEFRKKPSSILKENDAEWTTRMDACMKLCKSCIMDDEMDETATDEEGRGLWLCRKGQPWFGKENCKYYVDNPYWEDTSTFIPLIREEMKRELENEEKSKGV